MKCANCGQERQGAFCRFCGQNDRNYQRSLPPLLSDLLRETFELDSRLYRTLKLLLFKPGELALEFSRNRRANYVSPIRLYLFVSLLFFFLLTMTTDFEPIRGNVLDMQEELAEVEDTDVSDLEALLDSNRRSKVNEILVDDNRSFSKLILLQVAGEVTSDPERVDPLNVYLLGQMVDALYEPTTVLNQLLDNLPIATFVMLPVYALLLKLFYFGRHRYYVENLVFATHLHTFVFLIFTVLLLLPEESDNAAVTEAVSLLSTGLTLVLAIYHYTALKRYFNGGWLGTLFKFSLLMFIYMILLTPVGLTLVLAFTLVTV